MSGFETGLVAYLKAQVPLAGERVYPMALRQMTAFPALTYQKISAPREYTHQGSSNLVYARYQIDCWAKSYADVKAVADQVTAALSGYRGPMGAHTAQACLINNEVDLYEPTTDLHRVMFDVSITHSET